MTRRFARDTAAPNDELVAPPGAVIIDMEECEDIALTALQGLLAAGRDPSTAPWTAWREVVTEYLKARADFPHFMIALHGQPEADDAPAASNGADHTP